MGNENNERIVTEIIEYANSEIKKSKRKHLTILLSVLTGVLLLSVALLVIFAFIDGYVMWLFFGIAAIVTALLNIIWTLRHLEAKWFRFSSLAFTLFTICSFYAQAARWVLNEDWSALMDVLPGTSNALWFLSVASVVMNGISLFKKKTDCFVYPS